MNCTYCTDPETGRTVYGQRRKQPAGLATFQARKAAQEAAALAPYSVEKESIYSSAPWIVKYDGKAIGEFFPTKKAAVAWIEQKRQEKKQPAQEQTETPENHSETKKPDEKKEEKTMKKVEFTPAAIIVNGQEYAARYEYGETPKNHYRPTIRVFTELSGNACIVELPDDDPEYDNARAAMEQEQTDEQPAQEQAAPEQEQTDEQTDETPENHSEQEQPAQEQAETPAQEQEQTDEQPAQEQAAPDPVAELRKYDPEKAEKYEKLIAKVSAAQEQEQPEQTDEQPDETPENHSEQADEQPARNPKQARGPVPEKPFLGTTISGTGYSIVFDGGCNRTRVIVTDDVKEKARPIIEKAGFYYSVALDSWNKKLTFRAYRAAQELAAELEKALAA